MPHEFSPLIEDRCDSLYPTIKSEAYAVKGTLGDFSQLFKEFLCRWIRVCSSKIYRVYWPTFVQATDVFYYNWRTLIG